MTAPSGVPGVLLAVPVAAGAAPAAVQVSAAPPVGCSLINRGDHGGTVWLQAGPGGTSVALPPGASLVWTDPNVFPYLYLGAGTTASETVVVTSQAANYSNPQAVAAATAAQLAAQGIPSTYLSTGYGTYRLDAGVAAAPITVGQSAGLVVSVSWPQPTPVGAGVVRLDFTDPSVPNLPALSLYLTADNAVSKDQNSWQVPVLGPVLTVTNVPPPDASNSPAYVQVTGSNRLVSQLRQLGNEIGVWHGMAVGAVTAFSSYTAVPIHDTGSGTTTDPTLSPLTRMNGPVTIMTEGPGGSASTTGVLIPRWIDQNGYKAHASISVTAQNLLTPWVHPRVPVVWTYVPTVSVAGNSLTVTVLGGAAA